MSNIEMDKGNSTLTIVEQVTQIFEIVMANSKETKVQIKIKKLLEVVDWKFFYNEKGFPFAILEAKKEEIISANCCFIDLMERKNGEVLDTI